MPLSMVDLRQLASTKVRDATLLFEHGRHSNAYYLFGYGVELALKARIARIFVAETIPDKQLVNNIYSHDLTKLLALSGLATRMAEDQRASPALTAYWATVVDWSEEARYQMIDEFRSRAMRDAMLAQTDGVFGWLQNNW
jgi:hypothetical protein